MLAPHKYIRNVIDAHQAETRIQTLPLNNIDNSLLLTEINTISSK